jgi:hypothetical protein
MMSSFGQPCGLEHIELVFFHTKKKRELLDDPRKSGKDLELPSSPNTQKKAFAVLEVLHFKYDKVRVGLKAEKEIHKKI